ncbi:MAG: hypothetical protein ACTSRI_19505 [Promethearchaeota archaeon]
MQKIKRILYSCYDNTLRAFNGSNKKNINNPAPFNVKLDNYNRILNIVEGNVDKLVKKIADANYSNKVK